MWWGRSNPPSAVNGLGISPLSQGHIISLPPITFSLFIIFQSIMSYDSCIWRHLIKLFLMKEIHAIVFLITTKTSLDFFVWYYLLLFFLYFMFCLCSIIKSNRQQVSNDALYVYIQAHAHTWQGHECDNIANFMKLKFSPQKK